MVTRHSAQIVAMARPTYFSVLEEQAGRIKRGTKSSDAEMIDEVCCIMQEEGIIVENGAPALLRAPVWVLAGAPACLGEGKWVM